MLEALEPDQAREIEAYANIHPFGDTQLTRLATMLLQADGAKVDYEDLREREPAPNVSPQEAANARIRSALGG